MKRLISSSTYISPADLKTAVELVKSNNYAKIDLQNHIIVYPCSTGISEQDMLDEGMLGSWFVEHGFNVEFDVRDYEYKTKGTFNVHSMRKEGAGNTRYLRNRTVMKITW
jgi:hypothetical protein